MKDKEDLISILIEEIDEQILERMPGWFRILKDTYKRRKPKL